MRKKIKHGLICGLAGAVFLIAHAAAADTAAPTHQIYYFPPNSNSTEPILVTLSQPPLYSVEKQRAALLAANPVTSPQPVLDPLPPPQTVKPLPAISQPNVAPLNAPPVVPVTPQQQVNLAMAPPDSSYNIFGNSKFDPNNFGTRGGIDLGVQESYYRYREPDLDVTLLGNMTGFTAQATAVSSGGYFATADVRYAFGWLDYRGSGTATDEPNDLWDVRGLIGKDFNFPDFTLSPYTGFGWRDVYNDARGISSIGAHGYRRENTMYYLPIGINPRFRGPGNTRFAGKLEYDAMLLGQEYSWLSDAGLGDPNILAMQKSGGSGVRAELMLETAHWSIGPFFNYWDIGASNVKFFRTSDAGVCSPDPAPCTAQGEEPRNHTTEAGVQFRWHLF